MSGEKDMTSPKPPAREKRELAPHGEEPPCPITSRPYFMHIEHPELGDVPTYGGPFDSYTTPAVDDSDGECELRCERYCHDRGDWIEGGESSGLYLVTELDWQKVHDYTSLEMDNAALTAERDALVASLADSRKTLDELVESMPVTSAQRRALSAVVAIDAALRAARGDGK